MMKKVAISALAVLIVGSICYQNTLSDTSSTKPVTSNSYSHTSDTSKKSTSSPSVKTTTPSTDYHSTNNSNSVSSNTNQSITIGEKNALASAKAYINSMAFSYSGLIEQLGYEGYSTSDATYAANNCGADWNEQAALSAKAYLNVMPFSRDGLIEQLQYESFTYEQAVYGAQQNGY